MKVMEVMNNKLKNCFNIMVPLRRNNSRPLRRRGPLRRGGGVWVVGFGVVVAMGLVVLPWPWSSSPWPWPWP